MKFIPFSDHRVKVEDLTFLVGYFLFNALCNHYNDCHDVCPSVCLSEMGMHCDHTVHFSADLSLRLDSPVFWAPWHQSMLTCSQPSFSSSAWNRGGIWTWKI